MMATIQTSVKCYICKMRIDRSMIKGNIYLNEKIRKICRSCWHHFNTLNWEYTTESIELANFMYDMKDIHRNYLKKRFKCEICGEMFKVDVKERPEHPICCLCNGVIEESRLSKTPYWETESFLLRPIDERQAMNKFFKKGGKK